MQNTYFALNIKANPKSYLAMAFFNIKLLYCIPWKGWTEIYELVAFFGREKLAGI